MSHDHHHHDQHDHHDHHHDLRRADRGRLKVVLALAAFYLVAEVAGGVITGSLALLADAGHMLTDVAALSLALFAFRMAERRATAERTYGFYRAEILASLANGATLVAISAYILIEAYQRLQSPHKVEAPLMMAIAAVGLVVNGLSLFVLRDRESGSLNIEGAWLHLVTDALGSLQVVIAGALIWAYGWSWADPVASVIIALLVVRSSWRLMQECVAVLMEGAPGHIDVDQVRDALLSVAGVRALHDLHIWTITSGLESLSAHVVSDGSQDYGKLLSDLRAVARERFGVDHMTIQVEPPDFQEQHPGNCYEDEQALTVHA